MMGLPYRAPRRRPVLWALGLIAGLLGPPSPAPHEAGPRGGSSDSAARVEALLSALRVADGSTDLDAVADCLRGLRTAGKGSAVVAEALVVALPERAPLHRDRDRADVLVLR